MRLIPELGCTLLLGTLLGCSSPTDEASEARVADYSYVLTEAGRPSSTLTGTVGEAYAQVFTIAGSAPAFTFVIDIGDSLSFGTQVRDSINAPVGVFRAAYFAAPGEMSVLPRHRRVVPLSVDSSSRITIDAASRTRMRGTFRLLYPAYPVNGIAAIEISGRFDVPRGAVRRR